MGGDLDCYQVFKQEFSATKVAGSTKNHCVHRNMLKGDGQVTVGTKTRIFYCLLSNLALI